MVAVCFYFQVHQPFRLRNYSVFANDPFYFDNEANEAILHKVADKCYRPATRLLLDLVRRHEGRFRISFAITGTALEQFSRWTPDLIDLWRELAETGACEFMAETSHHSLSFLYDQEEFRAQVNDHVALMQSTFGVTPSFFRNTELTYDNRLADWLMADGRFRGVCCEGVDRLLGDGRSPNYVYGPPGTLAAGGQKPLGVLLKNYRLSDDVAFRFSDRGWSEWPLRAETFAGWLNRINGDGNLCNLFMDYETFGEHQWAETGIFPFLQKLPEAVFDVNPGQNEFVTCTEAVDRFPAVGDWDAPEMISWADSERDLTAWLGNPMQRNAGQELYRLRPAILKRHEAGDEHILEDWRKLTTSDHLYYMCTKYWADGDVHKYFSPYDSPYDAYITFMNVLDALKRRTQS